MYEKMFISSAVSDYLGCGYEATKELCDADDAQFFELYSYKMIQPMTSAYQCEIGIVWLVLQVLIMNMIKEVHSYFFVFESYTFKDLLQIHQ